MTVEGKVSFFFFFDRWNIFNVKFVFFKEWNLSDYLLEVPVIQETILNRKVLKELSLKVGSVKELVNLIPLLHLFENSFSLILMFPDLLLIWSLSSLGYTAKRIAGHAKYWNLIWKDYFILTISFAVTDPTFWSLERWISWNLRRRTGTSLFYFFKL